MKKKNKSWEKDRKYEGEILDSVQGSSEKDMAGGGGGWGGSLASYKMART